MCFLCRCILYPRICTDFIKDHYIIFPCAKNPTDLHSNFIGRQFSTADIFIQLKTILFLQKVIWKLAFLQFVSMYKKYCWLEYFNLIFYNLNKQLLIIFLINYKKLIAIALILYQLILISVIHLNHNNFK